MSCCSACGTHACGCGTAALPPLSLYNPPGQDSLTYRVGRYADFRAAMQADLSSAALPALAGLRTRETGDASIALLDAWAVGAEVLSFYQERIANEGYLRTATERRSVLELARLVDYRPRPGVAASVYLSYTVDDHSAPVTIPAGARAQSVPAPGEQMQTFETAEPLEARREWNAMKPRLTLPPNLTLDSVAAIGELWVTGTATQLKPNDRLLFLFGDVSTGVQAIRRVQSVEVRATLQRSRIVLQPMQDATAAIVAAANAAIAQISSVSDTLHQAEWWSALVYMRKQLLLGADNRGSYQALMKLAFGNDDPPPDPVHDAVAAFRDAVNKAFGWNGGSGSWVDFGALFEALKLLPTVQPANQFRLQRDMALALGKASDTRPQMLLHFESRLADNFYPAWTSVAHGDPSPTLAGVFVLRMAAPLFGYNAPMQVTLTQKPANGGGTTTTSSTTDWTSKESNDVLSLDQAYDAITAGGYVAIQTPDAEVPVIAQAQSVRTAPRTEYGISGKTTYVKLANANDGYQQPVWPAPSMSELRQTLVYAQSEALTPAEQTVVDPVGGPAPTETTPRVTSDDANRLTLDVPVNGLTSGRWVVVEGQRIDVPGTDAVTTSELVMLEAVEQTVDPLWPGDTVHSVLVFANQGLAYRYRRDTVVVHANVVRATHGETRKEVLGSGSGAAAMQAFALKQFPLTYVSAANADGVQSTLTVRVNGLQWHEIRNLAFAGEADRSFVTSTDDEGKTRVIFGDGAHGARLPTGVENVTAVYRNGIGTPGNVRAGQITLATTKPLGVKEVVNPLRASGGADPETRDQARRNVPLAVLALDRLVSIADHADFARGFGGVAKASAVKLGGQVIVTIAGAADAPIDPTSDLYRNLLQALQRYGDPALPLQLTTRELLAVKLSAKVGIDADRTWEDVEPQVRAALLDRFGFDRQELARNIYLSEVVACIQGVRGVTWANVDAFGSFDEQTLLADFGVDNGDGKGSDEGKSAVSVTATPILPSRIDVLPARYASCGTLRAAQLAYLLPNVPDTLLLQEASP
ncbi:putative baseplate assembly protein [Dyella sp. BiH032]|uniref:putative baseplate assembly protein n=1 Tax=Dyella sp. BiH032 TaxID=3075430 RepID=UPI00289358B9|nr:putative baseplate assembly protein [Dyella sp. BiH032]WNL45691.1 putative baseplate assembly protein [Dyella sp. BiH032]